MFTTTTFSFIPSNSATPPFSFSFITEGDTYTGQCTWNLARQDWYLQLFDPFQNLVINHPLVSSPAAKPQNLAPGIFARSIIFYTKNVSQIAIVEQQLPAITMQSASVPFLSS